MQKRKNELEAIITEKKSFAPAPISIDEIIEDMQQSVRALNSGNYKALIKKHVKKINAYNDGSFTVVVSIDTTGSSSWARTSDIMINSHALCQLSYRGICYFVLTFHDTPKITTFVVIFSTSFVPATFYFPRQSPAKYHRR